MILSCLQIFFQEGFDGLTLPQSEAKKIKLETIIVLSFD
jgi:hypothetical protein